MGAPKRNPAPGGNRGGAGIPNQNTADSTAPIDRLLARLSGVKQVGPGRWFACCPAHADRNPSLSVRETSDGRILLYCFPGCEITDVLSAIGLTLGDLFPKAVGHYLPRARVTFPALPILRSLAFESSIVFYCGAALLAGEPFDFDRLEVALNRIDAALRVAEGAA